MAPDPSDRISASATSEDSVPPAKRRRVEVPVDSRNDKDMHDTLSSSLDSGTPAGPGQEATHFQAPQNAVPASDDIMLDNEPKPCRSLKEPFHNIVTIECGDRLTTQYSIDLALLCAQSERQFEIFTQAEPFRDQNEQAMALKKRAEAFHSFLIVHKIHQVDDVRSKTIDLIMESFEKFPIVRFQRTVAGIIEHVVDIMFQKNEMLAMAPNKGKKLDRSQYPKEEVLIRLGVLNNHALLAVVERINLFLSRVKADEKNTLLKDPIRAAVYWRILLPNTEPAVVGHIANWLSKQDCSFAKAKELLRVHIVAEYLGITGLAAQCMKVLTSAVTRITEQSIAGDLTLRDVLESRLPGHDADTHQIADAEIVGEIFRYTMSLTNPPAALQTLVVNAIVECGDEDLAASLIGKMVNDMKGEFALASMRKANRISMGRKKTGSKHGQVRSADTSGVPSYMKPQAYSIAPTDESTKKDMSVKKEKENGMNSEENDSER